MERRGPGQEPEVLLDPEDEDDQPGRDVIIMFAVFFEGGLAPLSLFLGWWLGHNPLLEFAWSLPAVALGRRWPRLPLPRCFLWLILRWPIGPLRKIKDFFEEEFVPLLAGMLVVGHGPDRALGRGRRGDALPGRAPVLAGEPGWGSAGAWPSPASSSACCIRSRSPTSSPRSPSASTSAWSFLLTGNLLTVMVTHALYDFVLMAYLLRIHRPAGPIRNPITPVSPDEDDRRLRRVVMILRFLRLCWVCESERLSRRSRASPKGSRPHGHRSLRTAGCDPASWLTCERFNDDRDDGSERRDPVRPEHLPAFRRMGRARGPFAFSSARPGPRPGGRALAVEIHRRVRR